MRDRVAVYEKAGHFTSDGTTTTVGRAFYLHFRGYNADPAQFSIIPDTVDPPVETAADPAAGIEAVKVTYSATTPVPFSSNLFFEPIPFEMLNTYETKP